LSNFPPIQPRALVLQFFAAIFLLFPALDGTPFRRAEIYFADAARAMVERGDWLVPYFRGAPFFDKPALTYWLIASSFKVLGFSAGVARLAPAFAALLVILATVWLGWLLWEDRASALNAGWILLATAAFMAFGRTAMSDMLLSLWTIVAMALTVAVYKSKRPAWRELLALGGVLGLGFLTKGPIALLIPGLGIMSWIWYHRTRRPSLSLASVPAAVLAFAVFALGWFLAVYLRLGAEPIYYFFVHENLQRFSGAAYDAGRPAWFYLVTYLGQGAPWSLFLPSAAFYYFRTQPDPKAKALLLWMLLVSVLLTASHGKVDYYLLPLYPVSALLVSRYLCVSAWGRFQRRLASFVLVLIGVPLCLLPLLIARIPLEWRPQGAILIAVCVALVAAGFACLGVALRPRPGNTIPVLVSGVSIAFAIANVVVLPDFFAAQPNSALIAAASREKALRPDVAIASSGDPTQVHRDLLFYSRIVVQDSNDLQALAESPKPYLLLTNANDANALRAKVRVREVGSFRYLSPGIFTLRGLFSGANPDRLILLANYDF